MPDLHGTLIVANAAKKCVIVKIQGFINQLRRIIDVALWAVLAWYRSGVETKVAVGTVHGRMARINEIFSVKFALGDRSVSHINVFI